MSMRGLRQSCWINPLELVEEVRDFKFALGIKNINLIYIYIIFFTHRPMCVSTVYSVLSMSPANKKISQSCYSGGILAILEQCLTN